MSGPDPRAASRALLRGVGFMVLAMALLPFLNASVKHLTATYPVAQIVFARYAGHLIFVAVLFAPRRGMRLLATRRPGLQLSRSLLLLLATVCYFSALLHVPLATAAAIGFTAPLIVTLLAIPMLGEVVGARRWAAAAFGFAGALVVIRPGLGATHWAASLVLGTAVFNALYQIFTRQVAAEDSAETSITYAAVVGTVAMLPVMPFVWVTPRDWVDAALFLGLGVFAGAGHYFIVRAFQTGPASVLSPFNYLQLLGATILGYALFGDVPDAWTGLGAGMIVASGIYTVYRESVRRREARPPS